MNKILEVLLTLVALAGLYSAVPKSTMQPRSPGVRADQAVVIADGTDPMPLCRRKTCTQ